MGAEGAMVRAAEVRAVMAEGVWVGAVEMEMDLIWELEVEGVVVR